MPNDVFFFLEKTSKNAVPWQMPKVRTGRPKMTKANNSIGTSCKGYAPHTSKETEALGRTKKIERRIADMPASSETRDAKRNKKKKRFNHNGMISIPPLPPAGRLLLGPPPDRLDEAAPADGPPDLRLVTPRLGARLALA